MSYEPLNVNSKITEDKNNEEVEVTLPTDLIGLHEKFDFETLRNENRFLNVADNADGTVTVKMSGDQQKEIQGIIKKLIDQSISDILLDDIMGAYYSDIKVNDDCTAIQVYVPEDSFDMFHRLGLLPVKISCMIYQAFSGSNEYGTDVFVFGNQSDLVIDEYYYSSEEL